VSPQVSSLAAGGGITDLPDDASIELLYREHQDFVWRNDGGPWVRLPPKHTTTHGWQMMMLDDLFFFDGFDDEQRRHITHGTLADPDAAKTAVALGSGSQHVWVGTAHGIFVNESSRILRVPLALE
jgi:hypothetical protein